MGGYMRVTARSYLDHVRRTLLARLTRKQFTPSFGLAAVLRQNVVMMHSLQKQNPKTVVSACRCVPGSLVRDVLGLLKPLSGQTPALREERCSLPGKETAGPCCNRLRSAPFVAMVQATHLRDLHDVSSLRPLHDPSGRSVLG